MKSPPVDPMPNLFIKTTILMLLLTVLAGCENSTSECMKNVDQWRADQLKEIDRVDEKIQNQKQALVKTQKQIVDKKGMDVLAAYIEIDSATLPPEIIMDPQFSKQYSAYANSLTESQRIRVALRTYETRLRSCK